MKGLVIYKYLDQQNINNAYVPGMKEGLNHYGNELNYFTTYFNVAYCIMLIPSQIILTFVRLSFWLPGLEILWDLIAGLITTCHNAKQVYVLRVFLDLCESSAWPGIITLFMHWYIPTELAKRMGFYHSCQAIGSMVSGALQVAISNTLDGGKTHVTIRICSKPRCRWLFVINAIITVSALVLRVVVIIMTCSLRYIDVRYMLSTVIHCEGADESGLSESNSVSNAAGMKDSKLAKEVQSSVLGAS
ncbi:hypothetical protein G7Y89_g3588 [Cudoniella acicularis]|uniref:Uncharacterized protein n=1 Tax=Cudoniella acicularis TaxID=354080 RepID=A0A8H4RR26_9HELO|nr:hypothetical protein G7Y89_g3588 [Cudoniella acicularis]